MKFIQKWSYACANGLMQSLNENHEKRGVYYYGFQVIIGAMVKGVFLVSLSLLLGILLPTILITVAFASLRMLAGGYHMDTYGKCILVSLGMFIAAGLVAQYTYTYWSLAYLIILIAVSFIMGLYIIIRYAPKDTPNKPITAPQEIKKFKRLSLVYLFVWLGVTSVFAAFNLYMYAIALCFGVLLELFAVSPTGHKFFDMVKAGLTTKKAKRH